MLRLDVLPEGYIYPKEERPIRDLLRKRAHLVRLRTSLILSLQNVVDRNCGMRIKVNDIKRRREDRVAPYFEGSDDLSLTGKVSKEAIDFFTVKILEIERFVEGKLELKKPYPYLLTIPGIGKILGLTIMLETGLVDRFAKVGNYVSYCRKVSTKWVSNDKTKGKGNKKNGNKYLAWAFSEAAEFARRYDEKARAYYNRKMQKTNFMVAHNALAHKLARAAYHIMKDQVPFMPDKLFTS
jgi:transposase